MNFDVFNKIVMAKKEEKPIWFELDKERKAEQMDIVEVEIFYGIIFPQKYKKFLLEYGGGYFAFTTIYTCNKESKFYIINKNNTNKVINNNFISISDNGAGDMYGFVVENSTCKDNIFIYCHEDQTIESTKYVDVLEFILHDGLRIESFV